MALRASVVFATLGMAVVLVVGCGDRPTAPYPTSTPPSEADTALGPGDVFQVRVYGEEDLSGSYQVAGDGTINFPLIGAVTVAGLTPTEVQVELQRRLADGYLKNPQVSVLLTESRSKKVSVLGQVKSPGTFPYTDQMTIIEAITKAGGFTPIAKKNSVRVTRTTHGKQARIVVAVEDISQGKAPNFVLHPGDVVFVPERAF